MVRRPLLWVVLLAVSASWLPYLFGWWLTPPGTRYFWLIHNPDDPNVHLMWARQAMDGAWCFADLFTTEEHPGLFVNIYSLLLGWFCRLTGISLHLGYQILRTVVVVLFLITAHWFGSLFLREERARSLFLWLLAFSSGFGWVLVLWWWQTGQRPPFFFVDVSPELIMPEANSFLSLTVAPLAALGVTLVMGALGNLLLALTPSAIAWRRWATGLLCGFLVVNVHTYAAVPLLLTVPLWQGWQIWQARRWDKPQAFAALAFTLAIAFALVGQGLWLAQDPVFVQKARTPTLTPNPVILIGSYGFLFLGALLALPTLRERRREGDQRWLLPLSWTLALLVAIYLPVSFQRKMIEGLHVVLCLFTALALSRWLSSLKEVPFRWVVALLVLLTIPSQVAFFALNGYWLVHNNLVYDERFSPPYTRRLMPPYYLPETHLHLFRWLEQNIGREDAVLCHPMVGNYLPVLTGRRVFIGHWAETLNFAEKLQIAFAIWSGQMPIEQAQQFFRDHRIRYAVETAFERAAVGGATQLPRYGRVVFRLGDDRIFELAWETSIGDRR